MRNTLQFIVRVDACREQIETALPRMRRDIRRCFFPYVTDVEYEIKAAWPFDDRDIRSLNLTVRAENVLRAESVETIAQLVKYDYRNLRKIRNCGMKTARGIEEALHLRGLCLNVRPNPRNGKLTDAT